MILYIFDEWKNCIVNDCKIELIEVFIVCCLKVYEDWNNLEIRIFVKFYG